MSVLISQREIMKLLKDYKVLDDVDLSKQEFNSQLLSNVLAIAEELRFEIAQAYAQQVTVGNKNAMLTDVVVRTIGKNKVVIEYTDKALFRQSLARGQAKYTGIGIDDILALLTNGYNTNKKVCGFWHGKYIASKTSREPNPFISIAVNKIRQKYGDVIISYPKEWGGDI